MKNKLCKKKIEIPNGFAITSKAYDFFIKKNKLQKKIKTISTGIMERQNKKKMKL